MTDYSTIVPADPKAAQILLSDTQGGPGYTPYNRVLLVIGEDGEVSLRSRTYYGGDGTPMDEWHGRTSTYVISPNADAEVLRSELGVGGRLAALIDRIVEGHSVEWDGNNNVGRLTEDAVDAAGALEVALDDFSTYSDQIATAEEWITGGGQITLSRAVEPTDTATDLLARAEADKWLILDGLAGFEAAVEEAASERAELADDDGEG